MEQIHTIEKVQLKFPTTVTALQLQSKLTLMPQPNIKFNIQTKLFFISTSNQVQLEDFVYFSEQRIHKDAQTKLIHCTGWINYTL